MKQVNRVYKQTSLLSVGLSLMFWSAISSAGLINISTSDGNGADTFISSRPGGDTTTNFGSSGIVAMKNDLGSGFVNRKGYLRFDTSSVTDPLLGARLDLTYINDTEITISPPFPGVGGLRTFNIYGLLDGNTGEGWDESLITWNNAPANNTSSASGLLAGQFASLGSLIFDTSSIAIGDTVSFSSSALDSFLLADTNDLLTLIMVRQDKTLSNIWFSSKENASGYAAPTLALTTRDAVLPPSPAPEPSTLLLTVIAFAGLGWMKKRRHEGNYMDTHLKS